MNIRARRIAAIGLLLIAGFWSFMAAAGPFSEYVCRLGPAPGPPGGDENGYRKICGPETHIVWSTIGSAGVALACWFGLAILVWASLRTGRSSVGGR